MRELQPLPMRIEARNRHNHTMAHGETNQRVNEIIECLQEMDEAVGGFGPSFTNVITLINNLNNEIDTVENSITDLESSVSELEDETTSIENSITGIGNSITGINNEVKSVKNSVTGLDNEINAVENSVSTLGNKVIALENKPPQTIEVPVREIFHTTTIEKSIGKLYVGSDATPKELITWVGVATVSTSGELTVTPPANLFSNIASVSAIVTVPTARDVRNASFAYAKSWSPTSIVLEVVESKTTGVLVLNTAVEGVENPTAQRTVTVTAVGYKA